MWQLHALLAFKQHKTRFPWLQSMICRFHFDVYSVLFCTRIIKLRGLEMSENGKTWTDNRSGFNAQPTYRPTDLVSKLSSTCAPNRQSSRNYVSVDSSRLTGTQQVSKNLAWYHFNKILIRIHQIPKTEPHLKAVWHSEQHYPSRCQRSTRISNISSQSTLPLGLEHPRSDHHSSLKL